MQESVLSFENISKSFGVVKALSDVSFDVRRGEILGLLGANGAGKSTLLKILGGIQTADSGRVLLGGGEYFPKSAHEAKQMGVVSVYQELNMFCNMTVAENLFVGNEKCGKSGLIDLKATFSEAAQLLTSMGLDKINAKDLVESLSVANRQIVEIARAINENPQILLLDEPTASLSEDQINWLFEKVRTLVKQGTTVIYVSHRLDEVTELCDRCVVLRDGMLAAVLEKKDVERETIVYHMVGRELQQQDRTYREISDKVVLSCDGLSYPGSFSDITFDVHSGEILGIAGLVGAGRSELLNTIYGASTAAAGTIKINGEPVRIHHPKDALAAGIALVSEDRKKEGLFLPESAKINFVSSTLNKRAKFGFINRKKETGAAEKVAGDVQFDPTRLNTDAGLLSGGNQQKVVIGKSLLADSSVLLLDEPTRGVDVGARNEIYEIIKSSSKSGRAVVLVSSDWEELTMFADRVIVMSEGRLVGELSAEEITQQNIMRLCTEYKTQKTQEKEPHFLDKLKSAFSKNRNASILGIMLLFLFIAGPIATQFFFNPANFNNIIWQSIVFILLTLGQLAVVITGGIDLSLSACMTVSGIIGIKVMLSFPGAPIIGLLIMLLAGLAIGALNGFLVVYRKIDSFIATLAVQLILQGTALILTPKPIGPAPEILKYIANNRFLGLPIVLYIGIIIFVVFAVFYKRTRIGRHLFAVGESAEGASWLGLRVKRIRMTAYMLCSFMGVLAGYYMLGRSGAAEPTIDVNLMLNSVAYALIGGGTLAGGKGSIAGSVLAALVIVVLMNILNHVGLVRYWQDILRGVVIMAILIMYERKRKEKLQSA